MMFSLGLDISATSTGVVGLLENGDVAYEDCITFKGTGMARVQNTLERIDQAISLNPERIVIEGYGFANKNSLATLVTMGAIVRYALWTNKIRWLEPAPLQVKKFALGSGKGEKSQILKAVYKRWGYDAKNDDIADAYVCARIGLAHAGKMTGLIREMLDVVGSLAWVTN